MKQSEALALFEYRDGALYWKLAVNPRAPAGARAGSLNRRVNRVYVRVNRVNYLRSRLVFLMHHGWLPDQVDHIDCNRTNDDVKNLRAATKNENQRNKCRQLNNSSGVKNVRWRAKKWVVELKVNSKLIYFGRYDDLELADLVAMEARNKYHGAFANHG